MESFDNMTPIVGSRRPIFLPAFSDHSSSSSSHTHTPTPPSALSSATSLVSSSRSRRKPAYAFKSPSAEEPSQPQPGEWEAHHPTRTSPTAINIGKRASPPYERRRGSASTDASRSSAHKYTPSVKSAVQRHAPLLPLYHPLGPLAQSLPRLDPGLFGLPSSLSIDDGEDKPDAEGDPRSSSGSRRAGPKGREDDTQSNGTPNGVDKAAQDATARERNASPRKRRGGGGGKRKRKDADDADGMFPPPAKRTRNPRGAAANSSVPAAPSPLVGPAVVASDLALEEIPENNGVASADAEEPEEAQEEPEIQQTPKRTRTRKPRATRPAKRRDSSGSASAASSVSVSIAAATRAAAAAAPSVGLSTEDGQMGEPEPEPEPTPQPEPRPELRASEPPPQAPQPMVNGVGAHEEADSGRPSGIPSSTRAPIEKPAASGQKEKLQQSSTAGDAPPAAGPSRNASKDVPLNGVTHTPSSRVTATVPTAAAAKPLPKPPTAVAPTQKQPPPPRVPPQKEEREEGELSD
ncbi:hypothetical protein GSI_03739 [Ganoderma sinense ZZ0214-1]|uniref:Uncharacterized protein n=1 Tax=Ganoderma sinense ZZ0214-1 TaxID=1077348 RepID=A0A2G8SJV3_9APHY|nr:hypothetical protein GSI_03739 [Ganoderma sinense ZZ0214-1]